MHTTNIEHVTDEYRDTIKIQKRRHLHLEEICESINHPKKSLHTLVNRLLVDDVRRFIWCVVPKVACTTWKRILEISLYVGKTDDQRNLSEDVHNIRFYRKIGLRHLDNYSTEEIQYRLDNYFSFMFVRDPYARLLSAWKDKLKNWRSSFRQTGMHIINEYRYNSRENLAEPSDFVQFDEFIRFLADKEKRGSALNKHWKPYEYLCYPCEIKYDFIGKLETMSEDAKVVLDKMNAFEAFSEFPAPYHGAQTSRNDALRYYANISQDVLRRLRDIYYNDFLLFDYNPDLKA